MRRMLLTMAVLFLLAGDTGAGDWPGWRGPTGMGITDARDLPLIWGGEDGANILWATQLPGTDGKAKLDHNQSSPIVWKDHLFLIMVYWPEGVAQSEFPEHHVACYRAADGQPVWDIKVPPGPWLLKDLRGGYSAPTPCTDGERIYALFGSSELVALDMKGGLVWRKEITPYAWDVAIGTSPILYQDTVLVLADGTMPKHSRLIAFDRKSGDNIVWEQPRPTASFNHSTPVLVDNVVRRSNANRRSSQRDRLRVVRVVGRNGQAATRPGAVVEAAGRVAVQCRQTLVDHDPRRRCSRTARGAHEISRVVVTAEVPR